MLIITAMICYNILCLLLTIFITSCSSETDVQYRLNSNVWPTSYEITITPYFNTEDDKAFTFDGHVKINLKTEEDNVNQIKLHSEDLEFTSANITLLRGTAILQLDVTEPLTFEKNYSFVYIKLTSPLQKSIDHSLTISYQGQIRSDLYGFYRSSYVECGVTK